MLNLPAEDDDAGHQYKVEQTDRKEVFPFEAEELVDSETGESPLKPDDDERKENRFADEPDH